MLTIIKNISLSAVSSVKKTLEGTEMTQNVDVIRMTASTSRDGSSISINKNIVNNEEYLADKEKYDAEMADFEAQAFALING